VLDLYCSLSLDLVAIYRPSLYVRIKSFSTNTNATKFRLLNDPIHAILHEEDCELFIRIRIRIKTTREPTLPSLEVVRTFCLLTAVSNVRRTKAIGQRCVTWHSGIRPRRLSPPGDYQVYSNILLANNQLSGRTPHLYDCIINQTFMSRARTWLCAGKR